MVNVTLTCFNTNQTLPIEKIPIVRDDNVRLDQLDVLEKPDQRFVLVLFVEHRELALVFRFGRVLEIVNVLRDDFAVYNEEALEEWNFVLQM